MKIKSSNDIYKALAILAPEGYEGIDPKLPAPETHAEYLDRLLPGAEVFSQAEMEAALGVYETKAAEVVSLQSAREQLRQSWEQMPDFILGPYDGDFQKASRMLDRGKKGAAIAVIQYAEPRAGFSKDQEKMFAKVKAQMIEAIERLKIPR